MSVTNLLCLIIQIKLKAKCYVKVTLLHLRLTYGPVINNVLFPHNAFIVSSYILVYGKMPSIYFLCFQKTMLKRAKSSMKVR